MALATTGSTYANYDISEIGELAASGESSFQSTMPVVDKLQSLSDFLDISNYRSGQRKFWTRNQEKYSNILDGIYKESAVVVSPQQKLLIKRINELKRSLGLADEEVASILKTTRKTLHNWQQGNTKPNKTKLLRLIAQHNLLNTWLSNGYPHIATLDVEDKHQVLQMLQQDEVDIDRLLFFGSGLMMNNGFDVIEGPFD